MFAVVYTYRGALYNIYRYNNSTVYYYLLLKYIYIYSYYINFSFGMLRSRIFFSPGFFFFTISVIIIAITIAVRRELRFAAEWSGRGPNVTIGPVPGLRQRRRWADSTTRWTARSSPSASAGWGTGTTMRPRSALRPTIPPPSNAAVIVSPPAGRGPLPPSRSGRNRSRKPHVSDTQH